MHHHRQKRCKFIKWNRIRIEYTPCRKPCGPFPLMLSWQLWNSSLISDLRDVCIKFLPKLSRYEVKKVMVLASSISKIPGFKRSHFLSMYQLTEVCILLNWDTGVESMHHGSLSYCSGLYYLLEINKCCSSTLWPWPLAYDLDLQVRSRYPCTSHTSLYMTKFKSLCLSVRPWELDRHTHTHIHR